MLTTHYLEEAELLCDRIAMLKGGRIVALDATENLIRRFHALYLRVRLDGHVPEAAYEACGRRGGQGGRHTFKLTDYAEVETVLAALREAGTRILEMELVQPDLEEVFVHIMRGEE